MYIKTNWGNFFEFDQKLLGEAVYMFSGVATVLYIFFLFIFYSNDKAVKNANAI